MQQKFIDKKTDSLTIFMLGWGMDPTPMEHLTSESSILYLYDYKDLEFDFNFSKFNKFKLVAFSCGVYITPIISNKLPQLDYRIAINGTLNLFSDNFGLSKQKEEIFNNITLANALEFREKYLLKTKNELVNFNKNQPKRSLESSIDEFKFLKYLYSKYKEQQYSYNKILISKDDNILPAENQKNFWQSNYKVIKGGHFPFFNFETIEEILNS